MNFNFYLLKSFRILLLPFSLLYGLVIIIRNWLFDKNILNSSGFNLPLICIGNLSVGGTGKSPMVEYLLRMLQHRYKMATLSRGYKRKTRGYALAGAGTTALEIGDEPMQFHIKFPGVAVAVGEARMEAVPQLLHDKPDTQVILLDDAFQHRSIKPGFNILLTDCNNLFTRDFFLPTGDLRDQRSSYKRADIVVVTKCPPNLSVEEKSSVAKEIAPLAHQKIFFCATVYGLPYQIISGQKREINLEDEILLVCGIANPKPLKNYLSHHAHTYYEQLYNDHHIFTIDDLNEINQKFKDILAQSKIIITTEKDAVRLMKFEAELKDLPLYVLPVEHSFLFNEGQAFEAGVVNFVINFFT
ncbi:MAG: tetraacyldisaccharide 4'-kinase [Chitinophagaceae bacterium]|nr:tetraacyldisaccharide 4'-kinase [Chitinophagaceae bacterium]